MLRELTMVCLLSFSSATSSSIFNNSILVNDEWPIANCSSMFDTTNGSSSLCRVIKTPKEICHVCNSTGCTIRIAVLFPSDESYILNLNRTTTVIRQAVDNVKNLLPNLEFEIIPLDDECKSETALEQIIVANEELCPHVIFGPMCEYALASVARIAKIFGNAGTPLLTPGGLSYDFTSAKKVTMSNEFYHLINIGSTGYASFAEFLLLLTNQFQWKKVSIFWERNDLLEVGGEGTCYLLQSSLLQELKQGAVDYVTGDIVSLNITYEAFLREKVGTDNAITLTCGSHTKIRKLAIEAAKLGMMDRKEYLFFNFGLYNNAPYPDRPWYDDNDIENNELAKKGFSGFLTFYPYREAEFDKVLNQSFRGSFYVNDLYNGMLMYAQTLQMINKTQPIDELKGCDVVQQMLGKTYQDENNNDIIINCNAQKVSDYALVGQDDNGVSKIIGIYSTLNKTVTYWEPGNFTFPPDEPECGFDLSKCPSYDKVDVLLIILISVICVGLVIVLTVIYRHYKLRAEIYSEAWKVSYDDIVFLSNDRRSSIHSIVSAKEIDEMSLAGDKQLYARIGYYKSIRVALKKLPEVKIGKLGRKELFELKTMKDLSNDNLVKFYGACIECPNNCLLIEYCPRGSLQDILENSQYNLDWLFRISLINDIARGMSYLHASPIKSHGALKSSNCLVDSRFVLKISDFGLHFLRGSDKNDEIEEASYEYWKKFLWTAPELLRISNPPPEGTQKADVYSFAIIMQEIIMREGVFYVKGCVYEPKVITNTLCVYGEPTALTWKGLFTLMRLVKLSNALIRMDEIIKIFRIINEISLNIFI